MFLETEAGIHPDAQRDSALHWDPPKLTLVNLAGSQLSISSALVAFKAWLALSQKILCWLEEMFLVMISGATSSA